MTVSAEPVPTARRRLILHDSLAFLSLIAITVVLFAVTLFLFPSFMTHRADLAARWADRGRAALASNQPQQAVAAFRAALSYAPGERADELLLAQALADAGRTEEAYNYFMELWETHPGDGSINLRLARLAATKRDSRDAVNFYRASIYGTWEGDGVERRRAVRLELARYLIAQRQLAAARVELLVAGGNAPDSLDLDLTLAKLLEQADSTADALTFYQKALAIDPKNFDALGNAGRIDFAAGDYQTAHRLLERATREHPDAEPAAALFAQTERLLQLQPSLTLPAAQRVTRVLAVREIAKQRLTACFAALGTTPKPQVLQTIQTRWTSPEGTDSRTALLRDPAKQAAATQLAYDTEAATAQPPCPAPTGDDTLLRLLAKSAATDEVSHP